jgi:hypothetical protein
MRTPQSSPRPSQAGDRSLTSRPLALFLHSAPGTLLYLFALFVTSLVLRTAHHRTALALLRQTSTNLSNMQHRPVQVLLASAFVVENARAVPLIVPFAIIQAPAERWLGTARWALAALLGHIGATVVTFGAVWWFTDGGRTHTRLTHATDVGFSYGLVAVAALLTYRLPRRWAWSYATVLTLSLATAVTFSQSFTQLGHLAAALVGFALWPLTRSPRVKTRELPNPADEARRLLLGNPSESGIT